MIIALATTLLISVAAFIGIWLIHVKLTDVGIVDYYWAPGFLPIALAHAWFFGFNPASWLVFVLLLVWSVRLTSHLIDRHHRMTSEDARYAAMRASGGETFWWKSLFTIFMLQGILQWIIASPLHVIAQGSTGSLTAPLVLVGLGLFVIGFIVEAIADWQLRQFRLESSGPNKLMQTGLWSSSRHPNYLGEMILWVGIGFIAYSVSGSFLAFVGPLVLISAMWFVSIPLTEDHLAKSRPEFAAYANRTPILFPSMSTTARDLPAKR
jgi:steroid 5-alpha reductase family enzyme